MRWFTKIFIKTNGHARNWVKHTFFDEYLQIKQRWRFIVYNSKGQIRSYINRWYVGITHNPAPEIDASWVKIRNELLRSSHFAGIKRIVIVTPLATIYVARMLQWQFNLWKIDAVILNQMPDIYNDDLYIVICAQMFIQLPPREKRIVFQMEQTVSDRWFSKEYFNILHNSLVVFDYSVKNIEFIKKKKNYSINLHHVPIICLPKGILQPYKSESHLDFNIKDEIIFYGDHKSPRRKRFLKVLEKHFNLRKINGVYGEDLWNQLKKARIIINIHYYENALLETTRINECLSLGLTVISETAVDQEMHKNLEDKIIFTPINDVEKMVKAIEDELTKPLSNCSIDKIESVYEIKTDQALFKAFSSISGILA